MLNQSNLKIRRGFEFNGDVHLSCFESELSFLQKLGLKHQNCMFKMKFVISIILNMLNTECWICWIPFLGRFGPKKQNVWLIWKFLPRLIQKCWAYWQFLLFLIWVRNTHFGILWSKKIKLLIFNDGMWRYKMKLM